MPWSCTMKLLSSETTRKEKEARMTPSPLKGAPLWWDSTNPRSCWEGRQWMPPHRRLEESGDAASHRLADAGSLRCSNSELWRNWEAPEERRFAQDPEGWWRSWDWQTGTQGLWAPSQKPESHMQVAQLSRSPSWAAWGTFAHLLDYAIPLS